MEVPSLSSHCIKNNLSHMHHQYLPTRLISVIQLLRWSLCLLPEWTRLLLLVPPICLPWSTYTFEMSIFPLNVDIYYRLDNNTWFFINLSIYLSISSTLQTVYLMPTYQGVDYLESSIPFVYYGTYSCSYSPLLLLDNNKSFNTWL